MAPFHIDAATGSDEKGDGSANQPYQSLGYVLFVHGQEIAPKDLLFRTGTADAIEYKEPSQSALKKAKKEADGLEKKRKRAEEAKEREAKKDADEAAKRAKKIEESKAIVLEEDPSLPAAVKVRILGFHPGLVTDRVICAGQNF